MSSDIRGNHTRKEILSQPDIWTRTLKRLSMMERSSFPDLNDYDQVVFSGCGSTYYLSRWAARVCESETGIVARAAPSSELFLFPDAWLHKSRKTLLVAISRSAQTTETIRAMEYFQNNYTGDSVVITCYPDRRLGQMTPHLITVPDAQEESVAQTRSFSNMVLAVSWFISGRVPTEVYKTYKRLGQRILVENSSLMLHLATDPSISSIFFLGSGPLYGLASEAMLKMKEMSLSYAEAFHFLEFRHGPMSMVDEESLIVGLVGENSAEYEFALMREMQAKGARTLVLAERESPADINNFDFHVVFNSSFNEIWRAPLFLMLLQLMAYERSMWKGLDPDRPTNLSSVVVLDE